MSKDNVQNAPGSESSPIKDDQGVATQQAQDQSQQGEVGTLIADAKKYRQRAQKVESELAELKQKLESQRQTELEQILSEFNEEDRETFGDLPLSKLQALHGKIVNKPKIPIANNPAIPANEVQGDWSKMTTEERRKNWTKVISGYASARK